MNSPEARPEPLQDPFLLFSYFGLYAALKRHRTMTFLGWGIVALGLCALLLFWGRPGTGGLASIAVAVLAIVAGVALVQVSVAALSAYTRIPFPDPPREGECALPPDAVRELKETARAVESGGWQEASAGLDRLRAIGLQYALPPPG